MFKPALSDNFKNSLKKIAKKDWIIARAINRKVKEILNRDHDSITFYKNLGNNMSNFKRVHITSWLVMTFQVDIKNNIITFIKIGHRDDIYKVKK